MSDEEERLTISEEERLTMRDEEDRLFVADEEERLLAGGGGGDELFLRNAARCRPAFQALDTLANLCVPPDPRYDEPPDPEMEEVLRDIDELKESLRVIFNSDVRNQIIDFIRHLNRNRDAYRRSLLLWLDLIESLAFEVELAYGDNTGPVKLRRVRASVFYLVSRVSGGLRIPGVPGYLNRLILHFVVRGTVEYIVTLVNADEMEHRTAAAGAVFDHGLWIRDLPRARGEKMSRGRMSVFRRAQERVGRLDERARVTVVKWWEPAANRIVNWIIDKLLAPPPVPPDFKLKVDAMIDDIKNTHQDVPPVEAVASWFLDFVRWAGQHGTQIRAAIDVFSIAINWTAQMSEMSRERRIKIVTEALIRYFAELGMSGPFFRFVLRLVVDINLDAIHFLYVKRRVIEPAETT